VNLDSALIGVVVGSILSLLGNYLTHRFSMQKEEKQWQRKQESEDKMRRYDEQRSEKERIRNIYHICISRLCFIVASIEEKIQIDHEKLSTIRKEAFDWLSMLSLHHRELYYEKSHNFHKTLRNFSENPNDWAIDLLEEVYKLAMPDKTLYPELEVKKNYPSRK
jgi:hypothetical protein